MKKIIISFECLGFGVASLQAQDMWDALRYSEMNYYGTARSIAIGNAVTALGGDPGSVTINPAGSAVNSYSQFEFTPGLSTSKMSASYSPVGGSDNWTSSSISTRSRMTFPNFAAIFNFDCAGHVRRLSFGIVANSTTQYFDKMSVSGRNEYSSMMGAMASAADGTSYSALNASDAYNNSSLSWSDVLAYKSYMIGEYGDYDDKYVGSTEKYNEDGTITLMGPLDQRYTRNHSGSRTDFAINFAADIDDKLYLGVNLGLPVMNYRERLYSYESPVDINDFQLQFNGHPTQLVRGYKGYFLDTEASGVYFKIGGIYRFDNLRIGASFQTPTWYRVNENWGWEAQTTFSSFKESSETPEGSYSYRFTTPMIFDLGLAYTIGKIGFISMDWERVNNTSMRFRSQSNDYGWDEFEDVNNAISDNAGNTNMFRFGAEIKASDNVAVRAGYTRKNLSTSDYTDVTKSWSFGLGYSTKGSFYADIAVRNTRYPDYWYYPYDDYMTTASPEVRIRKRLNDVVLTFGWRF